MKRFLEQCGAKRNSSWMQKHSSFEFNYKGANERFLERQIQSVEFIKKDTDGTMTFKLTPKAKSSKLYSWCTAFTGEIFFNEENAAEGWSTTPVFSAKELNNNIVQILTKVPKDVFSHFMEHEMCLDRDRKKLNKWFDNIDKIIHTEDQITSNRIISR